MRTSILLPSVALAAGAALLPAARAGQDASRGLVAIKAGTIHLVEGGRVVEDGTILIKDGRIHSVGADVSVPLDAEVTDYGPDAVVIPGVVAADSSLGEGRASRRTAEPGLRAIENFDFYDEQVAALQSGVTSAYLQPTESRLIGGEGAVVKLAGEDPERRTLAAPAAVSCAVHAAARSAPGYWDPPVPATVDVGIGFEREQLPKTVMGAVVAFDELLSAARGERPTDEYGPHAVEALAALLDRDVPWRVTAQTEDEIRAVIGFAERRGVPVILEGAAEAGYLAEEIAAAGVPVVYELPWSPRDRGTDRGKDEDARWLSFDAPAKLVAAGARVAIAASRPEDVFFAAALASQGDLDPAAALRAITLTPAELYGVADRVGSIAPGKDADLAVLNGPPIALGTTVRATWVDGELAWSEEQSAARAKAKEEGRIHRETVAILVDELHLGDGRVLSPGQVVIRGGKIVSVFEGSSTPAGARIVRGAAAMPGIVDALGHLGLEGSDKAPGLDTALAALVAPGDDVDRRVARAGVTTVAMAPRGTGSKGARVTAYKPAAREFERQVVADPAAVRLQWTDAENRRESGEDVRELLEDAKEYAQEWAEYEKELASWTPPEPEPEEDEGEAKEEDDEEEDDEDGEEDEDEEEEEDAEDADPVTGVWRTEVARPPLVESSRLRMQLRLDPEEGGGPVEGNLRCSALTAGLVDVEGYFDEEASSLSLKALGTQGWITLRGEVAEDELDGTIELGSESIEVAIERVSTEYVVAARSRLVPPEEEDEPKGKPREPRVKDDLEPLKSALEGKTTVVVNVDRADEILACVATFERYGIKPVLYGASGLGAVAGRVAGRVKGVIGYGSETTLSEAGIPFAFHSRAEEGAAELPVIAMYAVAQGLSPVTALRALTGDAAKMLSIEKRVGLIAPGRDGDVVVLDGPPLSPGSRVTHVWVNGLEVE